VSSGLDKKTEWVYNLECQDEMGEGIRDMSRSAT